MVESWKSKQGIQAMSAHNAYLHSLMQKDMFCLNYNIYMFVC